MKNIIGFNIAWFGLVYWADLFIPIAIIFLLIHLILLSNIANEKLLIIIVALLGISIDSVFQALGIFIFNGSGHIPYWLMLLWSCFAATLCHSLLFLSKSLLLQCLAGLLAPFSYIAGSKFGAVDFGYSLLLTYLVLALTWILLFMMFFKIQTLIINTEVKHG